MNKSLYSLLKQLGLSEDLAKVYLAALQLGQSNMQELADKSGLKRTSVYNFTKELIERRFIIVGQKKKRKAYSAIHPNQLVEIEKNRLNELQYHLPELLAVANESNDKPKVSFFDGLQGIKEVYADILQSRQSIHEWSDATQIAKALGDYYFETFPEERAKRKIPLQAIMTKGSKSAVIEKNNNRHLRDVKYLSANQLKTAITIYGKKVAMISFDTENPYGVIIEDPNMASTLIEIWAQQWESLA